VSDALCQFEHCPNLAGEHTVEFRVPIESGCKPEFIELRVCDEHYKLLGEGILDGVSIGDR